MTITTYNCPIEEKISEDYKVWVDEKPVNVHCARVSQVPFNQVWPGYQRPEDQTEIASFATWDGTGLVEVRAESTRPIQSVEIKPLSLGIKPEVNGNIITFKLRIPTYATVEVNGTHHALHLFSNSPEQIPDNADTLYFSPGVHYPGIVDLHSGQTVHIAGGAVVYGGFRARNSENIRICGRGILDQSRMIRQDGVGGISMTGCNNIQIEGIIFRDPNVWTITLTACQNVHIDGVKLIGLWRYNSDGIDLVNTQNALIENCFIRSFDDSIVLKGFSKWDGIPSLNNPVRDILVRKCTIWNDWGRALEIGAETAAPEMNSIRFEDIDIIRTTHIAMDIQHGDRAFIHDVVFKDIRCEFDDITLPPVLQTYQGEVYKPVPPEGYCPQLIVLIIQETMWSQDKQRGTIRDIYFKDIKVYSKRMPPSYLGGHDEMNDVKNVTIQNLKVGGKVVLDAKTGKFTVDQHVNGLIFIE